MKINKILYIPLSLFLIFLAACSTKKDKWANRNFQALNTKYNVLYHGNIALEEGVNDLKSQYKDNFWEILPIERMQVKDNMLPGETKNANFERAELKATKAIQKRSMHIEGKEKNAQIDEAYLLLGKSRYYDQRFIPALEAFNYILYKNPDSDKIYDARIWTEKTNMRLDNDALAVKNLNYLLGEKKFKPQVFADANATIAQAYINLNEKNKALVHLKKAIASTELNEEKARYNYIIGQLYEEMGKKDSAFSAYQEVINMKRKSPRIYIIHAQGQQSKQFDFKKGDTLAFTKKYKSLLNDRENKPFLDQLYYQLGLYYDEKNSDVAATKYYKLSLKAKSTDRYLIASNYKNLAKINFDHAKYIIAGKYYDSTLVNLEPRTREYNYVKRKRENLDDVIKYEGIAQKNDSILNVLALSEADKIKYYEAEVTKVKKADQAKADIQKAAQDKVAAQESNSGADQAMGIMPPPVVNESPSAIGQQSAFYFYTPSTVSYGKIEFQKRWGDRPYKENWRLSSAGSAMGSELPQEVAENESTDTEESGKDKKNKKEEEVKPEYTTDFYIKQLPSDQKEIATLVKDRDFAYYQLGLIYKEKFTEYQLAADKLERLLTYNPEERLVLPSMYHLYKIYDIIDKTKALAMKNKIIAQYPDSRYANILSNNGGGAASLTDSPDVAYNNLFKLYEAGDYFKVLEESSIAIDQFTGEEIVPKYEFLKANTIGKLKGVSEYKNALNFVALNYPNSYEGKEAEAMVSKNIPVLEALNFKKNESKNWNILYRVSNLNSPQTKALVEKVKRFTSGRTIERLTSSMDIYTMTEHLLVIHGISSEEKAHGIVSILKDYKDYRISEPAIIISSENYAVVQIKKNLEMYLDFSKPTPIPEKPIIPTDNNPVPQNTPNKAIPVAPVIPGSKAPGQEQEHMKAPNTTQSNNVPVAPANKGTQPSAVPQKVVPQVIVPQTPTPASNAGAQPVTSPQMTPGSVPNKTTQPTAPQTNVPTAPVPNKAQPVSVPKTVAPPSLVPNKTNPQTTTPETFVPASGTQTTPAGKK